MSAAGFELRDDGDGITFTGYAAVTDTPYEVGSYREVVKPGAFRRTLSENPDVVLLINHEGLPLARTPATLALEEDSHGLRVEAQLDADDPEVQTLKRKYARGDLSGEMSFAFRVTDQEWNQDHSERVIRAVTIHRGDVSIVTNGANDATSSMFRGADFTPEQRARRAEQVGTQVRGVRGGRIVAFGDLVPRVVPQEQKARRRVHVPDYTTAARAELDLLVRRMGYRSYADWRRANPPRSFYAQERAWLKLKRAEAGLRDARARKRSA